MWEYATSLDPRTLQSRRGTNATRMCCVKYGHRCYNSISYRVTEFHLAQIPSFITLELPRTRAHNHLVRTALVTGLLTPKQNGCYLFDGALFEYDTIIWNGRLWSNYSSSLHDYRGRRWLFQSCIPFILHAHMLQQIHPFQD